MTKFTFGRQNGLLSQLCNFIAENGYEKEQLFVVTDSSVSTYCLPIILDCIKKFNPVVCTIEEGEENKTLYVCQNIWQKMMENKCNRNSLLIAVGGGMICDMGAFVASTFKLGIKYFLILTIQLAQSEDAIGGKIGVFFLGLKNQIGTFSTPENVMINTDFLKTLPQRQVQSGLAEIVKHALIKDVSIIDDLNEVIAANGNVTDWKCVAPELLKKSVKVKVDIVEKDFHEQNIRKNLNFGHTIGHAIESACMPRFLHGEAVAFGMIAAMIISREVLELPAESLTFGITTIIDKISIPTLSQSDIPEILTAIQHDKKNHRGAINFVLLKDVGETVYDIAVDIDTIKNGIIETMKVLGMYENICHEND